jgi:hypothetical protein
MGAGSYKNRPTQPNNKAYHVGICPLMGSDSPTSDQKFPFSVNLGEFCNVGALPTHFAHLPNNIFVVDLRGRSWFA